MKKFFNVLCFIVLFIWQLPQNIVAILMLPFIGKLRKVDYKYFCFAFEASRMSGGISLGNFIFLSKTCAKSVTTIEHEFGHVKDSWKCGPIYLLFIGLPSICWATFKPKKACYYNFYTEKRANKNAGLSVDTKCRLYFENKKH